MFLHPAKIFKSLVLMSLALTFISCGKPRLFGKDMAIEPIRKDYAVDAKVALQAAKEALEINGYSVQKEDDSKGLLETHWQASTSDSHYVIVFNRQDRGTVGSYHKLVVTVSPKGSGSQVEIYSLAKSFVSNLRSTGIEEEKVFSKLADFTRKNNIEVTNVGLQ